VWELPPLLSAYETDKILYLPPAKLGRDTFLRSTDCYPASAESDSTFLAKLLVLIVGSEPTFEAL
jgi:hypothetical protein